MEKDHDNYHSAPSFPQSFNALPLDNSQSQYHHNLMKFRIGEASGETSHMNNSGMVDYMLHNNNNPPSQQQPPCGFYGAPAGSTFDKLSFADVMQFADFGPKLSLNQTKNCAEGEEDQSGMDPVFFLKFPVLNDKSLMEDQNLMGTGAGENVAEEGVRDQDEVEARGVSDSNNNKSVHQLGFVGEDMEKNHSNPTSTVQENNNNTNKSKRKRPRTIKTSQEVESQRMTHIAVERNRRKQMNEHLRVLRSLMPGSYVQRGDQASIIGGAIEFVRELEQLLQCLESQKRRRLLGEASRQAGDSSLAVQAQQQQQAPFFPPLGALPNDQMKLVEFESGLREETAENKSCLADVEVKLLGFDAMIKILSRRRPGQLIKTIAALEDLQLIILHTNITTIEQTVLYSFNVKVAGDSRFTAEDIASSVQQIFSFIHENTGM
ncbi:transcription factor FAMA isoform X2 [Neltuma alba]|uniref:transcription factor FAMA isoform X2 n=1 Tax=Neltuma alba TaxID=207710 RepID=UPI0010A3DC47|nr:transcription factor FAMA isoform X2 [Prosopis alba]XP_028759814.1 transcription factor FAMA isoform X2 [Prosopis alba]